MPGRKWGGSMPDLGYINTDLECSYQIEDPAPGCETRKDSSQWWSQTSSKRPIQHD